MAFILNTYEIENAEVRAAHEVNRPNLQAAVLTLARLAEWTNNNSDGWAYWKKPSTAATKLQGLILSRYFRGGLSIDEDITKAELKSAYTPIKSFLTRQGIDHKVIFINE